MADELPARHRGRALALRVLAVVLLAGGITVVVAHPWGASVSGPLGDPGGAILAELSTIESAVPPGSAITGTVRVEPHFTGSCSSTTAGIQVDISFSSRAHVDEVRSEVAAHLRKAGWEHRTESGPGRWYDNFGGRQLLAENFVYRWSKRLPQGTTAGATLQVGIPVTGWSSGEPLTWNLGATSPGVGEPPMHCAGSG